jgi:hypothetical protein
MVWKDAVGDRQPEQRQEHLRRVGLGDPADGLALARGSQVVDQVLDLLLQRRQHRPEGPRAEEGLKDLAVARVVRRVERDGDQGDGAPQDVERLLG